jgi:anti-sigma regulatory factor (Ser/Thr protein kinase)
MTINPLAGEGGPAFNREIKLDSVPASVREARAFVRDNLRALGFPAERIYDVVLIVSELATNAIEAAPETPFMVTIRSDGADTVLELHDCSASLPRMHPRNTSCERGRGLPIVDALCDEWSCTLYNGGKAITVKLRQ